MINSSLRRFAAAAMSGVICLCAILYVSVDAHAVMAQPGLTYAAQLSPAELNIYNALGKGMTAVTPLIACPIEPPADVSDSAKQKAAIDMVYRAYEAYYRDHPEVFWVIKSAGIKVSLDIRDEGGKKVAGNANVTIGYYQPDQVAAKQLELEAAVSQILATDPEGARDRIQYFHDTLTAQSDYDMVAKNNPVNNPEAYESYGALVKKKSVCEGYAKAFKLLCDRSGIPCVIIGGVSNGENHMWNYVQLDGKYYLVDATFDDPVGGTPNTKYLLRGKQTTEDHVPSGGFIEGFNSGLVDPVLSDTDHQSAPSEDDAKPGAEDKKSGAQAKKPVKKIDRTQNYTVDYSQSPGGVYSVEFTGGVGAVDSGQTVTGGVNLTIKARPRPGYEVGEITAKMGEDIAAVNGAETMRFGVTGDCVIKVTFKKAA